jgi:hypothetical protein
VSWFSTPTPDPKRVNTISDKQMADLQRRGGKANPWFTKKAVDQRKASERQRSRSIWS